MISIAQFMPFPPPSDYHLMDNALTKKKLCFFLWRGVADEGHEIGGYRPYNDSHFYFLILVEWIFYY